MANGLAAVRPDAAPTAGTRERLTVAYVHAGPPAHGVRRYGRLLAAEVRRHPEVDVMEIDVDLSHDRQHTRATLERAAQAVARADVVHVQYNNHLDVCVWGRRWSQLAHLRAVMSRTRAALVVTVHDMYERPRWLGLGGFAVARLQMAAWRALRRVTGGSLRADYARERGGHPDAFTLWWLGHRARTLLVCSDEERRRLTEFHGDIRPRVVPHFVEARSPLPPADSAKAALGLTGRRVVTLLGFIHRRKGYDLLIEAMRYLPADVTVVLAGGPAPDHESYVAHLEARARAVGAADRLRVTGYLADHELELHMASTDLAICPFASVAASGSVSTWISAERPILASDLPLITEYNRVEPGAIRTFHPYTAEALAQAMGDALSSDGTRGSAPVRRLREKLSIRRIARQHVDIYREVSGQPAASGHEAAHDDPGRGLPDAAVGVVR